MMHTCTGHAAWDPHTSPPLRTTVEPRYAVSAYMYCRVLKGCASFCARYPGSGVPHLQENAPPRDTTVALFLGTYGDPRGLGVSYGRGTPVIKASLS